MDQPLWVLRQYDIVQAQAMAERLGISTAAAILLQQRGCRSEEQCRYFLSPRLEDLTPPLSMTGMAAAVEIIQRTVDAKQPIVIFGDYDVDGVCSIVILRECLERLDAEVDYYIPDRFQEGYGLNTQAVQQLAQRGFGLLITVDCGIRSVEEVAAARRSGLQVIVTDHHLPGDILPEADVIINPHLDQMEDCKNLCGAGVAYQLARALGSAPDNDSWLDLAALATIADIVDLNGDNRILVKHGLQRMSVTDRPGLRCLMETGGIKPGEEISSWQIGFILGPRLNAAGRLSHARLSAELLYTRDEQQALYLAEVLNRLNDERKQTEEIILREASLRIAHQPQILENNVLVLDGKQWHHGVLGIVASRLSEMHRKPVILINWDDDSGRGSCRSIEGFDIHRALQACQNHLLQYGGHPMAAGLTIDKNQLTFFIEALERWSQESGQAGAREERHFIDLEIDPAQINCDLWHEIQALEPFGPGNPVPVLAVRGVELQQAAMIGAEGQHFRARMQGSNLNVIAFRKPQYADFKAGQYRADLTFQLDRNEFRGRTSLQLKIRQMKPAYQWDMSAETPLRPWLQEALGLLEQQRAVLLIAPTYRVLNKLQQSLELWLCEAALHGLHGHLSAAQRQAGEQALLSGDPGLYLVSSAYHYYLRQKQSEALNALHSIDVLKSQAEGAAARDQDNGESGPLTLNSGIKAYIVKSGEMPDRGRFAVYVNRLKTIQNLRAGINPLFSEAGLGDIQQRRRVRRQFVQAKEGFLLTDGNACGMPIGEIDGVWMVDLPFSTAEIDHIWSEMGIGASCPLVLRFNQSQVDANQIYLGRLYPDTERIRSMLPALRSLGHGVLQGEVSQFCQALSRITGRQVSALDLQSVLHVLDDLGLCQFKKKGSIMAIKFMFHAKNSINMSESPYYLEGLAEKKAFHDLANELQQMPLW